LASASHASTTKTSSAHVHLVTRPYTVWFLPLVFVKDITYSPHLRKRIQNCEDASIMPLRMSQKTCWRRFGENGSSTRPSTALHTVHILKVFKVITNLQTSLLQMPSSSSLVLLKIWSNKIIP
jgi:hypothetical protein